CEPCRRKHIVNFVMEGPLSDAPGFLVNAAPHSRQIAVAVLLGMVTEALWIGIAVTALDGISTLPKEKYEHRCKNETDQRIFAAIPSQDGGRLLLAHHRNGDVRHLSTWPAGG